MLLKEGIGGRLRVDVNEVEIGNRDQSLQLSFREIL